MRGGQLASERSVVVAGHFVDGFATVNIYMYMLRAQARRQLNLNHDCRPYRVPFVVAY